MLTGVKLRSFAFATAALLDVVAEGGDLVIGERVATTIGGSTAVHVEVTIRRLEQREDGVRRAEVPPRCRCEAIHDQGGVAQNHFASSMTVHLLDSGFYSSVPRRTHAEPARSRELTCFTGHATPKVCLDGPLFLAVRGRMIATTAKDTQSVTESVVSLAEDLREAFLAELFTDADARRRFLSRSSPSCAPCGLDEADIEDSGATSTASVSSWRREASSVSAPRGGHAGHGGLRYGRRSLSSLVEKRRGRRTTRLSGRSEERRDRPPAPDPGTARAHTELHDAPERDDERQAPRERRERPWPRRRPRASRMYM
jgi:hypothetical protein